MDSYFHMLYLDLALMYELSQTHFFARRNPVGLPFEQVVLPRLCLRFDLLFRTMHVGEKRLSGSIQNFYGSNHFLLFWRSCLIHLDRSLLFPSSGYLMPRPVVSMVGHSRKRLGGLHSPSLFLVEFLPINSSVC